MVPEKYIDNEPAEPAAKTAINETVLKSISTIID